MRLGIARLRSDLEKNSIPTVMIGRELQTQNVSSVIVDNEAGAYLAIEHLYALGHRKIAFRSGEEQHPYRHDRTRTANSKRQFGDCRQRSGCVSGDRASVCAWASQDCVPIWRRTASLPS